MPVVVKGHEKELNKLVDGQLNASLSGSERVNQLKSVLDNRGFVELKPNDVLTVDHEGSSTSIIHTGGQKHRVLAETRIDVESGKTVDLALDLAVVTRDTADGERVYVVDKKSGVDIESLQKNGPNINTSTSEFVERFSGLMTSDKFVSYLTRCPEDRRDQLMGVAIQYNILHKDGFGFNDFMESVVGKITEPSGGLPHNFKMSNFTGEVIDSVTKKLGLSEIESMESKSRIFDFIKVNITDDGYALHAFNGSFQESIQQHGLSTTVRDYDINRMRRMEEIFQKGGVEMALGWKFLGSGDEGKIAFEEAATSNTYSYAIDSPEWFSQLINSAHEKSGDDDKDSFKRREYASARRAMEQTCRLMATGADGKTALGHPGISEQEAAEVLDFFDEYWAKYAGPKSGPKLTLIRNHALDCDISADNTYQEAFDRTTTASKDDSMGPIMAPSECGLRDIIGFQLSSKELGFDCSTTQDIKPGHIVIIDLPDYNRVYPKMAV